MYEQSFFYKIHTRCSKTESVNLRPRERARTRARRVAKVRAKASAMDPSRSALPFRQAGWGTKSQAEVQRRGVFFSLCIGMFVRYFY